MNTPPPPPIKVVSRRPWVYVNMIYVNLFFLPQILHEFNIIDKETVPVGTEVSGVVTQGQRVSHNLRNISQIYTT